MFSLYNIFATIMVALGAVILFICSIRTKKIISLIAKEHITSKEWKLLYYLMIFFSIGYFGTINFIYISNINYLILMTGCIFFFGALFVCIVTRVGHKTIINLEHLISIRTQELKKSKFKLIKISERNKALLNAIPDMIFVLNKQGICVEYKDKEKRLTLLKAKRYVGKNIYDFTPENSHDFAVNTSQRIVHSHYTEKKIKNNNEYKKSKYYSNKL